VLTRRSFAPSIAVVNWRSKAPTPPLTPRGRKFSDFSAAATKYSRIGLLPAGKSISAVQAQFRTPGLSACPPPATTRSHHSPPSFVIRNSPLFRPLSFVLRTFSSPGPLLGLTDYVKFGTLFDIKAQWVLSDRPECRALLGDSQRRGNVPMLIGETKLRARSDAVRSEFIVSAEPRPLNPALQARSLTTRTRPFAIPETPPSAPWPAGYPCAQSRLCGLRDLCASVVKSGCGFAGISCLSPAIAAVLSTLLIKQTPIFWGICTSQTVTARALATTRYIRYRSVPHQQKSS
jgi:hypothetical protein